MKHKTEWNKSLKKKKKMAFFDRFYSAAFK